MIRTKSKKEATLSSVIIGAVAAAILGVILAVAHEVQEEPRFLQSASAFEVARKKEPYAPIFLKGSISPDMGWQKLVEAATQESSGVASITLTSGDLNELASQYLNFTLGKQQSAGEDSPSYAILPDTPNFALYESQLQITVPFEILLFGAKRSAYLVATGTFSDEKTFSVNEAWLNSAKVPPPVANLLLKNLIRSIQESGSDSVLFTAWSHIDSIDVKEDEMLLEKR